MAGVQSCVCAQDPYCCNVNWDGICASEAQSSACWSDTLAAVCGDGVHGQGEQCDDGNVQNGDGCSATCHFEGSPCLPHATPGDADGAWQTVCAVEPACCQTSWGGTCVQIAILFGAATCGVDACTTHTLPGSSQHAVNDCICNEMSPPDPWCCQFGWDQLCVNEAIACGAQCP